MTERPKHPDFFTPEEAADYCHLELHGIEVLRRDFGLVGYQGASKYFIYYREELDKAMLRLVGRDPAWKSNRRTADMRIAR